MQSMHVLFLAAIFLAIGALAYDNQQAHPGLTESAVKVFDNQAAQKLTQDQADWIIKGSVAEDADPRYLNHFYDPTTGQGLGLGNSAKTWALNGGWGGISGNFSEQATLDNYRNGNYQRAYEGVGHIAHLLQDMTVPAHVRNDPHSDDYYESWVKANYFSVGGDFILINNLGLAFDNLALYTHNNFYSLKTIAGDINYNSIQEEIGNSGASSFYEIKNGLKLVKIKYNKFGKEYEFDQTINPDYYAQLAPKAVGYSAGLIAYFQEKFEQIDQERKAEPVGILSFLDISQNISNWWQNQNYAVNDYIGSAKVQTKIANSVDMLNTSHEVVTQTGQIINTAVNDSALKTSEIITTAPKVIKQKTADTTNKIVEISKNIDKLILTPTPNRQAILGIKIAEANSDSNLTSGQNNINTKLQLDEKNKIIIENSPFTKAPINPFLYYSGGSSASIAREVIIENPIIRPETNIIFNPPIVTSSTIIQFDFSSDMVETQFEYDLDQSVWQISSSTIIFTSTEGEHQLAVRAFIFGASSTNVYDLTPAIYSWTVDTIAPVVEFIGLPVDLNMDIMTIGWQADSPDTYQYKLEENYNETNWLTILQDSTSTSLLIEKKIVIGSSSMPLLNGDTKQYRIQGNDVVGNVSLVATSTLLRKTADHLLISAVQVSGATVDDEWVEIYNPTNQEISLANYKLKRKTQAGNESNLFSNFSNAVIKAKGYYLIAHPNGYKNITIPDGFYAPTTLPIAINNTILLYDGNVLKDKIGFGTATDTEASTTVNLANNQVAVRKASAGSTVDTISITEKYAGHNRDTDHNRNDFLIVDHYQPHSSEIGDEQNLAQIIDLNYSEFSTTSVLLNWSAPSNAVRYDIRYQISNGNCNLNINWLTATSAISDLSAGSENSLENYTLAGLTAGTNFCVAIRTFNGQAWSVISNQLTIRTACAEVLPLFENYSVRYGRADNSLVPSTTPEYTMIVDMISGSGYYYVALPDICIWGYGGPGALLSAQYNSRSMMEFVYDPLTNKLTGKFRSCSYGVWVNRELINNRCNDNSAGGIGQRWQSHSWLVGADTFMVYFASSNSHTSWLKVNPGQ